MPEGGIQLATAAMWLSRLITRRGRPHRGPRGRPRPARWPSGLRALGQQVVVPRSFAPSRTFANAVPIAYLHRMPPTTDARPPALHAADSHDLIRVHGARENNLKDVSVELPEAPADRVHRGVGLGQELPGVRDDRRGVAADDQRDLQHVRPGLHADPVAPGRRRARRAHDGDHRRPGADGRQPPLDRRHVHRCQRDAAHAVQPARRSAHRFTQRLLVQRAHRARAAVRSRSSEGRGRGPRRRPSSSSAACAPDARGGDRSATSTSPRSTTRSCPSTRAH